MTSLIKPSFLIGVASIMLAAGAPSAEPDQSDSRATVRGAIALFRQEPFSPRGRAAGEVVRSFAEKNDDVIVQVTPKLAPFLSNLKIPPADRSLLLESVGIMNGVERGGGPGGGAGNLT